GASACLASVLLPRPRERAPPEHAQRVMAVGGGATDVIYRARRHLDELAEARRRRVGDRRARLPEAVLVEDARDEPLCVGRADRRRPSGAYACGHAASLRRDGERERAHRDHHRVARADLRELLWAVGGRDMERRDELVRREAVALRTGDELG